MIHRQLILVRLVATVALAASALGTAALPAAAAVTPSALHFRASFGLTTDPTVAAAISADPGSDTTSFGLPLTLAEVADLRARMAIQDQIDPLAHFVAAHADRFGGLWIDQSDGGVLVLETLPMSGPLTAQAAALAPDAATVRTTTATYDYASLSAHADRISAAMSQLSSGDMRIVSVGVDVPANRVKVGVGGASDSEQAALAASLGPDVEVVPGSILTPVSLPTTCSSRTSCPLRAGLNISNLGYKQCTSNFFFKSSTGVTYLGTAGHCASSTWYQWYEGGNTNYYIGNNSGVSWYNGMNADAMLITHYSSAAKNLVYVSSTEMGRAMGSSMNNASQIFGTLACYSGATSGYHCGQVVGSDLTENNNGYTEYHLWEMDPAASDGDSGSPVFYSTREMGLVDAVSGAYTYYSTIDWIDGTFGVTPCVTSSC